MTLKLATLLPMGSPFSVPPTSITTAELAVSCRRRPGWSTQPPVALATANPAPLLPRRDEAVTDATRLIESVTRDAHRMCGWWHRRTGLGA